MCLTETFIINSSQVYFDSNCCLYVLMHVSTKYLNSCIAMHDDKTLTSNFCIDMPQDDLSTGRNMLPTYKGNSFKLQQTCVKSD